MLTFSEWRKWLSSIPWSLRWFPIVVLFRPLIDSFYFLKRISPFLSPLYIVGVLTPILIVSALMRRPRPNVSAVDGGFKFWALLMFVSCFFLLLYESATLNFFQFFLKLLMPVYLYFFLRIFIRSKRDLIGILQTFLYSSIFVLGIFLYELIFQPIRVVESRGLERIQGNFADVVSYSIYMILSFLIVCYFYFLDQKRKRNRSFFNRTKWVNLVGVVSVAMLLKINHSTSFIVFFSMLGFFLYYNYKTNKWAAFSLSVFLGLVFFNFGDRLLEEKVTPLFKTDILVYEGKKTSDRLLHGRIWRWRKMFDEFSNASVFAQFFGMPLGLTYTLHFIGTGSHNDFIRVLMFTGYIGLITYLFILLNIYRRFRYLSTPEHFLAFTCFMILVLFSISVNPTFYAPMLYIIFSVFAFVALPVALIKK